MIKLQEKNFSTITAVKSIQCLS